MRAVFSAWFAASIVAVLALLALKALVPHATEGPVDEYAQVLRVHLPWLLFSLLMGFAADTYAREGFTALGRVLAALPVPLLAGVFGFMADVPPSATPVAVILGFIEAVLGVVLGLFVSNALVGRTPYGRRRRGSGSLWQDSES